MPTPPRRSEHLLSGIEGAYPRALLRAAGLRDGDFQGPLIGVANSWNEIVPGHVHLRELAAWVKEGIRAAGGVPLEFCTIAPCDGIAHGPGMHYSLPSRDVIAASVELMVQAHQLDGVVMLCTCDKSIPGMLLAAARLNLPTVFVTGGVMRPGQAAGRTVILSDVKEAMGRLRAGTATPEEFAELERCACPEAGACSFLGTAHTMACIVEAAGLSLPRCATMPALSPQLGCGMLLTRGTPLKKQISFLLYAHPRSKLFFHLLGIEFFFAIQFSSHSKSHGPGMMFYLQDCGMIVFLYEHVEALFDGARIVAGDSLV